MLRRRMMMAQGGVSLPAGYTKLEYLESDGTQYIDTGFKPNQDTGITIDFEMTSLSATGWLFCGRTAANDSAYGLYVYKTSGKIYFVYGADSGSFSSVAATSRLTCVANKNVCSINGEEVSLSSDAFTSSANLCLFARNTAGTIASLAQAKLYSCRIYDNGVKVRDYIPAVNASGVSGLYDLVDDVFYPLLQVVTKKENKITVTSAIDPETLTGYIRATASYNVASNITVNCLVHSLNRLVLIEIPKGSNKKTEYDIFPDIVITSISPTEDDTYIYTF